MSEWWTYRPSDFLMFSPRAYGRLVELYNRDFWPLQLPLVASGLLLIAMASKRTPKTRAVWWVLGALWLWVGWLFHAQRHAQINTAANYLAALFVAQAALFALPGLSQPSPVQGQPTRSRRTGLALAGLAVLVYPLLTALTGRSWSRAEVFGLMPEPTALATLGLLIAARPRFWKTLSVIPALSLVVGAGTLWLLAGSAAAATPVPAREPAVTWSAPVEIASGRGQRGSWQQNESRYDFVDDPTVLLDDGGRAAVAWVDQAHKDVLFRWVAAGEARPASPPLNVSRSPGTFSWLPRIARAPPGGDLFIAWQEIIFTGGSHGGDIVIAASRDGGRSFLPPVNLSRRSLGGDGKGRISQDVWHNGSFDLVAGPGGPVYVAWTEYDGALWFCRSTDGGRSFTAPAALAGHGERVPARAPSLALAPDGTLYLAWTLGENPSADVRIAKSSDGGASFGSPRVVAASGGYSDAPKVAIDGAGVVHLVFAESAAGPSGDDRIRYTRSADGGRTFSKTLELSPATGSASFPSLRLDRMGRVFVLWEQSARRDEAPRGLGFVMSVDRGSSFSTPTVVPASVDPQGGANGSSQGLLMQKLATNPSGSIAVVNSALKTGSHSRIWMLRGTVSGR